MLNPNNLKIEVGDKAYDLAISKAKFIDSNRPDKTYGIYLEDIVSGKAVYINRNKTQHLNLIMAKLYLEDLLES